MATISITCPSCNTPFEPSEVFLKEYEQKAREKMKAEWQRIKNDMDADKKRLSEEKEAVERQKAQQEQEISSRIASLMQQKEKELASQLQDEKQKLQQALEASIRKTLTADYENQLRMLQQTAQENEEKLKAARQKEFEYLRKEQELQTKEKELELNLQKKLLEERASLTEQIRKEEADRTSLKETEYLLKMKELEKQLEDQRKLAEEMKRKAEQGSMQLQGEVQELMLENMLQASFPFDAITPVGKGVRGADCIQCVRNPLGQECGTIIYESKRTKDFSPDWIEKLKSDMRSQGADVAVIVTQAFPKDMEKFGEKDGVYICSFSEVVSLASVLRTSILKIHTLTKSQENKGEKMTMLYNYLTSTEFSEQWKAIREGFMSMRISIQKERDAMEKLWKAREKQLEKVMLNAAGIKGSIEGIAGAEAISFSLDDSDDLLLLQ